MTLFAFTHSEPVKTYQRLRNLERHGQRVDLLARENLRDGAIAGAGLDWPDFSGRRLTKAYGDFKKRNDADPRKGAQLLHSVGIGVSPLWIREAGDLHDPDNPRNIQMFDAAIAWVKSFAGDDAIVSARMDLDEEGGGWVDVYFAPIRQQKYKGRSQTKSVISVNKCLEETALALGYPKGSHYAALNTSWAKYAREHLDPIFERGTPGKLTGKEHLPPRLYKAEQEAIKNAAAAAVAEKAAVDQRQALEAAMVEVGMKREELWQSHIDTTKTLVELLSDPQIENLMPRPHEGKWRVPPSIAVKVEKLSSLKGGLVKLMELLANKLAEVRDRLEAIVRREKQLDRVISELTNIQGRLKAEEVQLLEKAKKVSEQQQNEAPVEVSPEW